MKKRIEKHVKDNMRKEEIEKNIKQFDNLAKKFGFLTSCQCEDVCENCKCQNANTQG